MKPILQKLASYGAAAGCLAFAASTSQLQASSHMDAPLITLDPAANTTDVYAFRADVNNVPYLVVALSVYPFEEPGIGPNNFVFDPNVSYEIDVATGSDVANGFGTYAFRFDFSTTYVRTDTIAQAYLGEVKFAGDTTQNLQQRYAVTMFGPDGSRRRAGRPPVRRNGTVLFPNALVPPNNQGLVTRFYNQGDDGERPARGGVDQPADLDIYTLDTSATNARGFHVFAGQRDDAFYADIQSIFDLDFTFSGPNKPFDSQGGFNVHTVVLAIPLSEIGGAQQIAGVFATTSRSKVRVLRSNEVSNKGQFVQVGRQGNPLFCEAFIAIRDKDLYNSVLPNRDQALFSQYALNPELAALLNVQPPDRQTNRTDLAGIFIPDMIKVDLSTPPAALAGNGSDVPDTDGVADDSDFHRLSIFGGDVLQSQIQDPFGNGGFIPGGWPNGRRFGDDVVDIGVLAISSDLRPGPTFAIVGDADSNVDKVTSNEIGYNKVFPYAATPLNGRNHEPHHGDVDDQVQ